MWTVESWEGSRIWISERILAHKAMDHFKNNQDYIRGFPGVKITLEGVVASVYLGTLIKIVFDGCRRYRLPLKVGSLFPPASDNALWRAKTI